MLGILTFIMGFVIFVFVCGAILHTSIGFGKIVLGLILIGLSHVCDFVSWAIIKTLVLCYHLTR